MTDASNGRQMLASAYLLGHATEDQVLEFDALYQSDESFRILVADMESFLSPLNTLTPEAPPPEGLLDDIMSVIDYEAGSPTAPQVVAEPVKMPPVRETTPQRPWQFATAAAAAIAAGAIALHFVPVTAEPASAKEELLALMSGEEAPSVVVLLYDKDSHQITGRLTNTSLPDDGVWELWLLRDGLDGPQSLGLLKDLSESGSISLSIATELAAGSDTLAISVEPEGGSTEAGPTGPIVYTGKVAPI